MQRYNYAMYQTLRTLDLRQESGHRYTVFVVSTAAIDRMRTDTIATSQRFAIAVMEVCSRALARDNEITIRWVPAHHGITGNERADEFAKAATGRKVTCSEDVTDNCRGRPASCT